MSQIISQSGLFNDGEWRVTRLRSTAKHEVLDFLPLKRFPILIVGSRYEVEICGTPRSDSKYVVELREKSGDVQSFGTIQRTSCGASSKGEESASILVNDVQVSRNLSKTRAMITATLISDSASLAGEWALLVDGQPVLQDIHSLASPNDFIKRIWQAEKVRRSSSLKGNTLDFSPPLRRECKDDSQLWRRLVTAILCWSSKRRRSKLARSIQKHLNTNSRLIALSSTFRKLTPRSSVVRPPVTDSHHDIEGTTVQARSQVGLRNPTGSLSRYRNLRRSINIQPVPSSQIAHPLSDRFNLHLNPSTETVQGGKRKRPSLKTATNARKCPRTLLSSRSNLSPSLAASPMSFPGLSPSVLFFPAFSANQLNSADPIPSPSIGEEKWLGEAEMQRFLQENSLDPTFLFRADIEEYLGEDEMQSFLQKHSVNPT